MEKVIEAFAEDLLDDDREDFTFEEASELADQLGCHPSVIIRVLKEIGFGMRPRSKGSRVRGFRSNSHDRWTAYPSHGGSGWSQITGFAGKND